MKEIKNQIINMKNKLFNICNKNRVFNLGAVALVGLMAILTSWEGFRHGHMAALSSSMIAFAQEAKGLKVTAKSYSKSESKKYLNRNLQSLGYQPIQVTVENNTNDSYLLSRDSISQPNDTARKVASKVIKKALPRSIGLKIASLFFWPLMIPSTIEGIYTLKTQAQVRKELSAKGVRDVGEEVAPYSTYNRVIFVPKDEVRDTLTVTLNAKDDPKKAYSFIHKIKGEEDKVSLDPVE